jgi:hypothetical protein
MASLSRSGTRKKKYYDLKQLDEAEEQEEIVQEQPTQQTIVHNNNGPYPFMPLYSHYSLGQRLKSTLPFSKLFFSSACSASSSSIIQDTLIKSITTSNHTENHSSSSNDQSTENHPIIHDKKKCMFLMKLDSKGRLGKKKDSKKRRGGKLKFHCSRSLLLANSSKKCN